MFQCCYLLCNIFLELLHLILDVLRSSIMIIFCKNYTSGIANFALYPQPSARAPLLYFSSWYDFLKLNWNLQLYGLIQVLQFSPVCHLSSSCSWGICLLRCCPAASAVSQVHRSPGVSQLLACPLLIPVLVLPVYVFTRSSFSK